MSFHKNFQAIESKIGYAHFQNIKRGFEKESLRVHCNSSLNNIALSQTKHPPALGSALTHPFITTDYSESLLEFITAPSTDINTLFQDLYNIHHFTYSVLEKSNELLWTSSMPCHLPEEMHIPIANYGSSNYGLLKNIYRRGLGLRYSRSMQTIAGIHYNFSFPESFFEAYHGLLNSKLPLTDFISEQYLHIIRNCFRFAYILPLLLGASPAANKNFIQNKTIALDADITDTLYGRFATSLRLSDAGYNNNTQSLVNISYNSLAEFVESMRQAVHRPFAAYTELGVKKAGEYLQLSDCLLQVEDEHYALIRPKRVAEPEKRMLHAIEKHGIEYVEVRALDLNPFSPVGVEREAVYLLDSFLLVCLLSESPPLNKPEMNQIQFNMNQVFKHGRQEGLKLKTLHSDIKAKHSQTLDFKSLCLEILDKMTIAAQLLDKAYQTNDFSNACQTARTQMLTSQEQLLSNKVLTEMIKQKESYEAFIKRLSINHQNFFLQQPLSSQIKNQFEALTKLSLQEQLDLEQRNTIDLDNYIREFLEN